MSNIALIKYTLLLVTAPLWFPFVKALWEELNAALRLDGGLMGDAPSRTRRKQLETEIAQEEPRLVHETLAHERARRERRVAGDVPKGYRGHADSSGRPAGGSVQRDRR